jgi:hypothetical protein
MANVQSFSPRGLQRPVRVSGVTAAASMLFWRRHSADMSAGSESRRRRRRLSLSLWNMAGFVEELA